MSCVSGGGGGVNEIQSAVKGAKARDAQSWHGAGKELVGGGGGTLHPGSVCLSEHRDHISMTPKLPVLC